MKRKILIKVFVLIFVSLVFLPSSSFAQSNTGSVQSVEVMSKIDSMRVQLKSIQSSIEISPAFPKPGTNAYAIISSKDADLDLAKISWFVNDKLVATGRGLKNYTFITGKTGKETTITAVTDMDDGQTGKTTVTIKSSEVVLLWEAASYVPPFYKGKALPPQNGLVKIIALPDMAGLTGAKYTPKNLLYKWKINETLNSDATGLGKSSFSYIDNQYVTDGNSITTEVSTPDGSTMNQSSVFVGQFTPKILFYGENTLLGRLFNVAISDFSYSSNSKTKISAEPYFFTNSRNSPNLQYSWNIDGTAVAMNEPVMDLSRLSTGPNLNSVINLNVKNLNIFLQGASASIGTQTDTSTNGGEYDLNQI
ncbi:MAG: hypothetical protein WCJ59_01320 [bacterium]